MKNIFNINYHMITSNDEIKKHEESTTDKEQLEF